VIKVRRGGWRIALTAGSAVVLACLLSIFIQLIYPSGRTLPGTRLNGHFLTFKDSGQVQNALQELSRHKFNIVLGSKVYTATPSEIGLYYADITAVQEVESYSLGQRFIPFSMFFQHKQSVGDRLRPRVDQAKLDGFAAKLVAGSAFQPIEGVITVKNGKVTTSTPKAGMKFTAGDISKRLKDMPANIPDKLDIKGESVPPIYDTAAINSAARQATALITPISVTIDSKTYPLSNADVGSWLSFTPNPATKQIDVGFSKDAIAKSLASIASKVYKAPGTTFVTLVDGHETARRDGPSGLFLDTGAAASKLIPAITQKQSNVALSLSPALPQIHYDRSYTATQAGLQALLDYLVSSKGNYGIALREIGGHGWSASSGGGKSFITASTYKLFVAYSVLKRIDSGEYHWNDKTYNTDLSTCFNRMIINSDNPCAEAMVKRVGYSAIINEMHALGLNSTSHSDTFHSTPNDEALLVGKLARGEILSSASRDLLISLMKQQRYRQGIPAGSGVTVADKVGFLYGYLHDAAIVYGSTTYVLVIMTNNSSWSQIADAARQIHAQMSR
jgi:beta-lactamase class A